MRTITAGIDVGSTYTKAVVMGEGGQILGRFMKPTGFKLEQASRECYDQALREANLTEDDVDYVVATGYGRHQVAFKDLHVTELTAAARSASFHFPDTRTVLDVGGQTMKATGVDEQAKVTSFRLNDKCAAGTGAFLEKTARYMGFSTAEIGPLLTTSKNSVTISGVCAVFAESEVINHLSQGTPPADIMQGAIESLVGRSVQLIKRVRGKPSYTLIGGILRFPTMAAVVREKLGSEVNVIEGDKVQYMCAQGAAILGQRRLERLRSEGRGRGDSDLSIAAAQAAAQA